MSVVSRVMGYSGYLPEKILTNADISKFVDTTDEWITTRTGISKRHVSDLPTSDMAIKASKILLQDLNFDPLSLNLIIVATTTPDLTFPSTACLVQGAIGAKNAVCFDLQAACSGFVYALSVGDKFILTQSAKNVLIVGADKMSSIVNWQDRSTCILFGDGAGALLLSAERKTDNHLQPRIIDSMLYSDGSLSTILQTTGGVATSSVSGFIEMDGREVFRNAVVKMEEMISTILHKNNYSITDLDLIVPHQANKRIVSAVIERLGIDPVKAISTVDIHGNTSAASIPLAIAEAKSRGLVKDGSLIIMEAVGAGLTWGCVLIRL